MATLMVIITGCEVRKGKGDYFIMCQLDEASNAEAKIPSGKITMKRKTDVSQGKTYPQFTVNNLTFEDVIIFSDLSLKFGLFEVAKDSVLSSFILVLASPRRNQQAPHNSCNGQKSSEGRTAKTRHSLNLSR
eukprot:TRINITY_DN15324_c0_g1_i2.p1 TRINITY_DN15324_c0_g1~~TRINITY_DN15324_c0_g1_i2.p1  ORF type:complete len:132 (-),score=27.02 TRINITY_DN15324_c0_g1_i2:306-701(-)